QAGGGDGVLDGEVDADAADRGHRVGGVADAQHARRVPAPQAVHTDVEVLDVVHRGDRGHVLGDVGYQRRDLLAAGLDAPGAQFRIGSLAAEVADLEVARAGDGDRGSPSGQPRQQGLTD